MAGVDGRRVPPRSRSARDHARGHVGRPPARRRRNLGPRGCDGAPSRRRQGQPRGVSRVDGTKVPAVPEAAGGLERDQPSSPVSRGGRRGRQPAAWRSGAVQRGRSPLRAEHRRARGARDRQRPLLRRRADRARSGGQGDGRSPPIGSAIRLPSRRRDPRHHRRLPRWASRRRERHAARPVGLLARRDRLGARPVEESDTARVARGGREGDRAARGFRDRGPSREGIPPEGRDARPGPGGFGDPRSRDRRVHLLRPRPHRAQGGAGRHRANARRTSGRIPARGPRRRVRRRHHRQDPRGRDHELEPRRPAHLWLRGGRGRGEDPSPCSSRPSARTRSR